MNKTRRWAILVTAGALTVSFADAAGAQEKRRAGLVFGFPAAVAIHWQVSERFAIRPDFTYGWTSTESLATTPSQFVDGAPPSSETATTVGIGLSALFTVARHDNVGLYISPRAGHERTTIELLAARLILPPGTPLPSSPPTSFKTQTEGWRMSGSVGVRYDAGDRFAAFGEVGVAYSTNSPSGLPSIPNASMTTSGLRSGIGVIFLF